MPRRSTSSTFRRFVRACRGGGRVEQIGGGLPLLRQRLKDLRGFKTAIGFAQELADALLSMMLKSSRLRAAPNKFGIQAVVMEPMSGKSMKVVPVLAQFWISGVQDKSARPKLRRWYTVPCPGRVQGFLR